MSITVTIWRWQTAHPEFCNALKLGEEESDGRVERGLYHRAIGYRHEAVKIFMPAGATEPVYAPFVEHVTPDTTACIFWLKNQKPEEWRDRQVLKHAGADGGPIQIERIERVIIDAADSVAAVSCRS